MRNFDLGSWPALLATLLGLAFITVIGVGIRLLAMLTIQRRRERENRQINERLKTLIAAYKVLGGSFTGNLAVDPTHLRDLGKPHGRDQGALETPEGEGPAAGSASSDRARRTRDAVEAALSDIMLLGTDEHVRLAARAAQELVAGRPVHTAELVVSLRTFIRTALALDPIPDGLAVPVQGPTRPAGGRGKGEGGRDGRQGGGRGGGAAGAGGGGMGMGAGAGQGDDPGDVPR